MRKIMMRSVPIAAAVAVSWGAGPSFTDPGNTRHVVMVLLFVVTLLAVGFVVDAVAGRRD
ncbi:hypothetical protein [Streptomyces viridochromogenes]|uniref:hypothetical protein n=1 Tax=Streptomyces viridochromogenes TaxID=1938 RepID=UPI00131BF960|nr:hypothetical protein [Streptomyces viridochromogenes]